MEVPGHLPHLLISRAGPASITYANNGQHDAA